MTIEQGQSLKDITLQVYGDIERYFDVLGLNGLDPDSEPVIGQEILIDEDLINSEVADYFSLKSLKVATMQRPFEPAGFGIGYMEIGDDFEVA